MQSGYSMSMGLELGVSHFVCPYNVAVSVLVWAGESYLADILHVADPGLDRGECLLI